MVGCCDLRVGIEGSGALCIPGDDGAYCAGLCARLVVNGVSGYAPAPRMRGVCGVLMAIVVSSHAAENVVSVCCGLAMAVVLRKRSDKRYLRLQHFVRRVVESFNKVQGVVVMSVGNELLHMHR